MTPKRFEIRLAGLRCRTDRIAPRGCSRKWGLCRSRSSKLTDRDVKRVFARCFRAVNTSAGWPGLTNFTNKIVAGVGIQLRRVLPHPVGEPGGEIAIAEGRHAIVINVFTEPDWRRRGLATFLMERLIDWARAERLDRLVLHASDQGRVVYERLGFVQTNEMRFKDRLDILEVGRVVR